MPEPVVPDEFEPVGVWDASSPDWLSDMELWKGRTSWAAKNIPESNATYRVEFYVIDAPFAIVYRYGRNESGHAYKIGGDVARDDAVILDLKELPPGNLLRGNGEAQR